MPRLHFRRYHKQHKLTHYLLRFPAKFHPPAVRCLIDRYTGEGDAILDPFCGSGTLLVEAIIARRNAVGVDIDPLATFISQVKSCPIAPGYLTAEFERLVGILAKIRRSSREYDSLMHQDLAPASIARWRTALGIPSIPNIEHWFRVYVVLDLAKLRNAILDGSFAPPVRDFFRACFASIIRNSSNADPVPVSGLEVTAHMRRLDAAGRRIDPFLLFERRVKREIAGMSELCEYRPVANASVIRGDATALRRKLSLESVDAVITSPPYNTAVDYYRRHMLEMYWLELVRSHDERLALAPYYIGRANVRQDHPTLRREFASDYVNRLVAHARQISPARERAIRHYCASMERSLVEIAHVLKRRGNAIFVVGNSKWNGRRVRATRLLSELAKPHFDVSEQMSYPSQNRYMSYQRHNDADVNREHVIVLKKRS